MLQSFENKMNIVLTWFYNIKHEYFNLCPAAMIYIKVQIIKISSNGNSDACLITLNYWLLTAESEFNRDEISIYAYYIIDIKWNWW